jgi:hypothetical protein
VLINLLVDLLMPLFDPRLKTVTGGAYESLVDATAAPPPGAWRRPLRFQPGLWLAWAVMIAARC